MQITLGTPERRAFSNRHYSRVNATPNSILLYLSVHDIFRIGERGVGESKGARGR